MKKVVGLVLLTLLVGCGGGGGSDLTGPSEVPIPGEIVSGGWSVSAEEVNSPDRVDEEARVNIRQATFSDGTRFSMRNLGLQGGLYRFKMRLDMHGIWALRITIKGPLRDILVRKIEFRR